MSKVIAGVVSVLFAVGWCLYGVGCESNPGDFWLFAKIPALWFFGIGIPRIFVLGLTLAWFCGGIKLIVDGLDDVTSVRAFVAKLRAGKTAVQLLEEEARKTTWANQACEQAVRFILNGQEYATSITAISQRTGKTVDEVVLCYKLCVDFVSARCALIRQAASRLGLNCTLPEYSFPAVRVTESKQKCFGDLTPLLSEGDLIYSYDGKLIWTAEQLEQMVCNTSERDKVCVRVLRHVKTTNYHPAMGVPDEFEWQALYFDVPGGPIRAEYETQGTQPQDSDPTTSRKAAEDVAPRHIRFICPGCEKRLKCAAGTESKRNRCPNCHSPIRIPADV